MVQLRSHGAGCCGIRHLFNFSDSPQIFGRNPPPITTESIKQLLRSANIPAVSKGGRSQGKCVEAVITDTQFRQNPALAQIMADLGFKLKTRFHNNTGGMCNVLHRVSGERDIKNAARRNAFLRPLLETEDEA